MIRLFKKYEDLRGSFLKDQAGNMFTAVLGVVAIVGVLSVSVYSLLSGPIKTAAVVTAKSKAVSEMITAAQVLMAMATDDEPDSVAEAPAFKVSATAPTNGGVIPDNAGSAKIDPWGIAYGYCTWDHGTTFSSANRLDGFPGPPGDEYEDEMVIVIVSAGPDRTFDTTCNESGHVDGQVVETGDDIIERYSYAQAQTISGGGVWTVVDPTNIQYDDNIAVGGDARIDNDLIIGDGNPGVGDLSVGNNVNVTGSVSGALGSFTSVDIDGGTIDGVTINGSTIGLTTPAAGDFTTIGATTGNITTINATTGNFTDITVTDNTMVNNLTAQYLGASPQDAAFFRNASNIDAGTLDPNFLPTFNGDISNLRTDATNLTATVEGLQDYPITDGDPANNQLLGGTGAAWAPRTFIGDVTLSHSSATNLTATVGGLQGRDVDNTAPGLGQLLGWNGSAWIPRTVTGDGEGGDIIIAEGDPHVNNLGDSRDFDSSTCGDGEIAKISGGSWGCATDAGGFSNPATENLDMNGYNILDVNSVQITSDFRYKKQIEPMRQMLKRVTQIQPVTFFWNDWAKSKGRYDSHKHLGLIAQDVEAMFPEAVITSKDGHKGIDYPALSAVMLQAIRELAVQNQALQGQINDLKRQSHQ